MKIIAKLALATALLSSIAIFAPAASAAPFNMSPIATQGDAEIVSVAMTRRQRMMMHRRAMMKQRHMMRGHRGMRPSRMRSSGAMMNAPRPMAAPKDMSTSDTPK